MPPQRHTPSNAQPGCSEAGGRICGAACGPGHQMTHGKKGRQTRAASQRLLEPGVCVSSPFSFVAAPPSELRSRPGGGLGFAPGKPEKTRFSARTSPPLSGNRTKQSEPELRLRVPSSSLGPGAHTQPGARVSSGWETQKLTTHRCSFLTGLGSSLYNGTPFRAEAGLFL